MRHDYIYNHLNAEEFLIVKRSAQWQQILDAIESIDANQFLKISNDKTRRGEVLYNQVAINDEFKRILGSSGWNEMKTEYYVANVINAYRMALDYMKNNKEYNLPSEIRNEVFKSSHRD